MLRRASTFAALLIAAVTLSGCFVISTNVPAGTGPVSDPRLVGTWRGLEGKDGKEGDAFLHFQRPDDQTKPLRLVWAEDQKYVVYEFISRHVGQRDVFAARATGPADALKDTPNGYFLGFYEVQGDRATFHMLDAEKVGALIAKGKLKGSRPPGKYEMATLTGSPTELAAFLASPDAVAAQSDEPATLHRLTRAPQ